MLRRQTAPVLRPADPDPTRRRRHHYPLVRRDPRRFARGFARPIVAPLPPAEMSDLRRFAHTFGAAFLFVAILIG